MPIEELRSKYGTLSDTVVSVASSEEEEEEEEEDNEEEEETGVSGLEQLLEEVRHAISSSCMVLPRIFSVWEEGLEG